MNFCKLVISVNQRINDIFEALKKCECENILLIFPAHYSPLLEKKFINQLKKEAKAAEKKLVIVSSKKLVRDFLKKSGVTAYSIVPAKFKDGDKICLFEFLGNPTDKTKKEKKERLEKKDSETEDLDQIENKKESETVETKKETKDVPVFSLNRIKKPTSPLRAKIFFGLLFLLLAAAGLFYWQKPTANIVLRPKISVVPVLQNMILKLPSGEIDQTEQTLPVIKSILLDATITDTENVPTTGREYEVTNAKGKITLFNESDKPKFLVPSRLSTADGKIFRFKKNVTIPAKANKKPGRVVVAIEADEFDADKKPIGIKGNIEAGTELFFPALREDLQEIYYGKAINGPLVGGSTLTKYKINASDEALGEKILRENFKDRALQELEIKLAKRKKLQGENHIFLPDEDFIFEELTDYKFPIETVGTESQTVPVSGSLKVSGLVFDQNSVKKELRKFLEKSLDERQKIIDIDEKTIEYIPFDIEDFKEEKWGKISVKALATEQFSVDSNNPSFQQWIQKIKEGITNKSKDEIKPILANNQEIEEVVSIEIKPFWATKTPLSPDQIFFTIQDVK